MCSLSASRVQAHVGSPDTFFAGEAGPYGVQVIVGAPGVIPGLAEISVWVSGGEAEQVSVRPVRWDAGLDGAPPADLAEPIRGEAGLWTAELWLMNSGSYSVYVEIEGDRGRGQVIVPVVAAATERLEMMGWLTGVLLALGTLLFVGAVTAIGAGVRESVLAPGESPSPARQRAARVAMTVAAVVFALVLVGGKRWWDAEDAAFASGLYKPLPMIAEPGVHPKSDRVITLTIDHEDFRRGSWSQIVPDHGKLMHAFLVREDDLGAFAHVHPERLDHERFAVVVPADLPAGDYRIYADLTHASGYAQTLTEVVALPPARPAADLAQPTEATSELAALRQDSDDSWRVAAPTGATEHRFDDGSRMIFDRPDRLVANEPVSMTFRLLGADGPMALEHYMGMAAHAAVRRHDGAVFIHLHPTGTVSMAAQQLFALRDQGVIERRARELPPELLATMDHSVMDHDGVGHAGMHHGPALASDVSMPWAFPQPGAYRIWLQMKRDGTVYTGVFDVDVEEPEA